MVKLRPLRPLHRVYPFLPNILCGRPREGEVEKGKSMGEQKEKEDCGNEFEIRQIVLDCGFELDEIVNL